MILPHDLDAVLPDGTTVPDGLCLDDDGTLMMNASLVEAVDDWAEHAAAWKDLRHYLSPVRGWAEPHDFDPDPFPDHDSRLGPPCPTP